MKNSWKFVIVTSTILDAHCKYIIEITTYFVAHQNTILSNPVLVTFSKSYNLSANWSMSGPNRVVAYFNEHYKASNWQCEDNQTFYCKNR